MRRFLTASFSLALVLVGSTPGHGQGLLDQVFAGAPRPVPATLPTLPAAPAQPADPAPGFGGLTGGLQVVTVDPVSHQLYLQRLELEFRQAEQDYIRATQSTATTLEARMDAARRMQGALYRLQNARSNPGARFFPAFTEGDMTNPGDPDPPPGDGGAGSGGDNSVLPGSLRRIVFARQYARWPGGSVNRFVPGSLDVVIGQDQGKIEKKAVIIAGVAGPEWYNVREKNDAEADNKAEYYPGKRPDTMNPDRQVDAWLFDSVRGSGKNKIRTFVADVRREPDGWEAVYDPSGVRFARIRQESYTSGEGSARTTVVQRVYYREGGPQALASLVEGSFQGNPALILRMGTGPSAEPIFRFVFTGWLRESPHRQDARLRASIGHFLDAWVTTEPWRSAVGISHNFEVDDN